METGGQMSDVEREGGDWGGVEGGESSKQAEELRRLRADPRLDEGDVNLLESALTGEGLVPITSPEMFRALGEAAVKVKDGALVRLSALLTPVEFAFIRKLRVEDGYSWRAVAGTCYEKFGRGQEEWWYPVSNQLIGMDLCELAAQHYEEDYMSEPWN